MTIKKSAHRSKKTVRSIPAHASKTRKADDRSSNSTESDGSDMDKTLAFRLPAKQISALKRFAEERAQSVSEVIRSFLPTQFVEENEYVEKVMFVNGISVSRQKTGGKWNVIGGDGKPLAKNLPKADAFVRGQWFASIAASA